MQDNDDRRPLLEDDESSPKKNKSYASVQVIPREETGSSGVDDDEENEVIDVEAAEKAANKRMSKLIVPLAIGIFLSAMDQTIVASSYASIGSELKQLQNTSWVATGYMLTLTSFQPIYGKMSDIFGRKSCLIFAYTVFGIGSLFCGLARNMTELIAARAFAGLGGGGMTTVVSILVSDIVPLRSRGTWQGLLNIIFATGSATGAPLGGFLADGIGWRWAFLIQVPFTLIAILVVSFMLSLPKRDTSNLSSKLRRIDFFGAITLVLAVFTLLFGLDRGGNISWSDKVTVASLCTSAVTFLLFGFAEIHPSIAREPFAPKRIIAHRSLAAAYLCNLFGFGSSMCTVFHIALYFQAVVGRSASQAGLGLLPAIIGGVSGSLASGIVMQKTGKYYWLTAGAYGAEFVGTIVISLMTGIIVHNGVGTSLGLLGMSIGNGTGVTTTLIALIANAAMEDQAIATAVSYLFRSMGGVLGISIGSTLVQNSLRSYLMERLAGQNVDIDDLVRQVRESLATIDDLPPQIRDIVRGSYEEAVEVAFYFAIALAGAATICSFFIKEKPLVRRS